MSLEQQYAINGNDRKYTYHTETNIHQCHYLVVEYYCHQSVSAPNSWSIQSVCLIVIYTTFSCSEFINVQRIILFHFLQMTIYWYRLEMNMRLIKNNDNVDQIIKTTWNIVWNWALRFPLCQTGKRYAIFK